MINHSLFALLCLLFFIPRASAQSSFEELRVQMVEQQIKARGINHAATLRAMNAVPRHKYVPAEMRNFSYLDRPLPIGYGQTISQPYMVAYMTAVAAPEAHHKALEIGTGSGYQAAVLAEIVDHVYSIEIIPELSQRADLVLSEEYDNVSLKTADGFHGWKSEAPFDIIIVTAAAEFIPPPLTQQLKDGGKMLIPVGSPFMTQQLMLVEKKDGKVFTRSVMPVRFVPFTRADD